jgi:superfamily II DNA/RNA helicase
MQIDQQVQGIGYTMGIHSIAIYGGGDGDNWGQQKKALTQGADIVIATPGKLISHLNLGYVKFDTIKFLILDEADRMLDIGFYEDIIKIISFIPKKRQTLMFSATMAPKIRTLASKILANPAEISLAISKPVEGVTQSIYLCHAPQKNELIRFLITNKPDFKSILVFCSTKKKVTELAKLLKKYRMDAEPISSDLEQEQREVVLQGFKSRKTRILVATDVLSRGIDIKEIDLVINFDVPHDAEDYVHRVGRTARAEATGEAITLVCEEDMFRLSKIEKLIEKKIERIPLPESIGNSPEWKAPDLNRKRRVVFKKNSSSQNSEKKKTFHFKLKKAGDKGGAPIN